MRVMGFARTVIYDWPNKYRAGGIEALRALPIPGRPPKLTEQQRAWVYRTVTQNNPLQLQFEFALWTRAMVRDLIRQNCGVTLSLASVGRLLRSLGLTPQRPVRRAIEQVPAKVREWLTVDYPAIQAKARKAGAQIFFADEAGVRSNSHHSGTTWAPMGQTPVVPATGKRFGLNLVSAVSPQGVLRFMVVDGRMTAVRFIAFLKRLLHNQTRPIFLIVGPVLRKVARRQNPERNILFQLPRDPARREHPRRVGVEQHLHHHPRLIRRVATAVPLVPSVERRQIQTVHQIADMVRQVALGQPLPHVGRQQQLPRDPARREHPRRVGVEQHLHHHPRLIRRVATAVPLVQSVERRQIQTVHQIADMVRQVALRQPLPHVGRQQQRLVCIDGKVFRDHCMVIALGIDTQGRKHVLGLREGATETAAVTTGLLSDLVTRGLPTDRTLLFVIDGATGLRRAITDVFGSRGVVQRCQVHKWRNVIGHLPERLHASVGKALRDAWNLDSADRAARVLKRLAGSLEHDHPGAAASIREGLDETLTVQRLGLTGALQRTLRTTNIIENLNGSVEHYSRNVKRWRGGQMIQRWVASALVEAEKHFRRVRGYRDLQHLVGALDALAPPAGVVADVA